ncbi:MAG: HAMP domain-containing protein [Elusimicrobia bacterium]|nr:HAMP domain-containing protein [Elusimicrobiota bacterium]
MGLTRSGLFRKFVGVMGFLALVPVAILGYQLINVSRRSVHMVHTKLVQKLAEGVDEYFRINNEKLLTGLEMLKKAPVSQRSKVLRMLAEAPYSDIAEVSILDGEGVERVKARNPLFGGGAAFASHAQEPAFRQFSRTRRKVSVVVQQGAAAALVLYYPLSSREVLRAVLSLHSLSNRIGEQRMGRTGYAVLLDHRGVPLLYPRDQFDPDKLKQFHQWPIVSSALGSSSAGSSEFVSPTGRAYIGAYAPVFFIGNAVVLLQSRQEAYRAASEMLRSAAAMIFAVACICILGATWMARRLTEPLLALTKAAESVAHGDFLAQVDIRTGDELQELADTFNRMVAQLRAYSLLHVDRLIAEQRKTEAILFSINDGIIMTDKEGKIQLANRRAIEIFELKPGESLEGKPLAEVLPEGKLRDAVLGAASRLKPDSFKEVDLSTSGSCRYLRVTAHPVLSAGRASGSGVVMAVRDVTVERELDKMKEDFLHYITHDLRNPLGSVMGFLDVLLRGIPGVLNSNQQNIVLSIKRSTSRLMNMINNILDIAKMESGKMRLQLKNVSLAGLAGKSINILESLALQKGIKMRLEASEEFSIDADPDLIERVLVNLLGNAIKYSPDLGEIALLIVDEGAQLKICVEDHGEGIPQEYLDRLFAKFEQVKGRRRGGTGLGLTISKFFVESHLGRIWIESELGRGSRFCFTLPKGLALDSEGVAYIRESVT